MVGLVRHSIWVLSGSMFIVFDSNVSESIFAFGAKCAGRLSGLSRRDGFYREPRGNLNDVLSGAIALL